MSLPNESIAKEKKKCFTVLFLLRGTFCCCLRWSYKGDLTKLTQGEEGGASGGCVTLRRSAAWTRSTLMIMHSYDYSQLTQMCDSMFWYLKRNLHHLEDLNSEGWKANTKSAVSRWLQLWCATNWTIKKTSNNLCLGGLLWVLTRDDESPLKSEAG